MDNSCGEGGTICKNIEGSYECICPAGFELINHECVDIDECNIGIHDCDFNADCINTQGSFECRCHYGFTLNGKFCDDIDECEIGKACELLSNGKMICENTHGSYACTPLCNEGFKLEGDQCKSQKPLGCETDNQAVTKTSNAMRNCWTQIANLRSQKRISFKTCFEVKNF